MNFKMIILKILGLMFTLNCFPQDIFYKQQSELLRTDMVENLKTYIAKEMSRSKCPNMVFASFLDKTERFA